LFEPLRRRLASYAPNTQRAFAADWRMGRAWYASNNRVAFPAKPKDLVDYILIHSPPLERDATGAVSMEQGEGGGTIRRATTVTRWLASLATLDRISDAPDPIRNEDVKAARRTMIRGRNTPEQKAPLHWVDVQRALAELGDGPRDLRAKALIAVAYSTMARRAELVALRVEDISFGRDGDGTVTLRTKGGGERTVTSAEVARTFKRIALLLGLGPGRPLSRISARSTRIGAAQDLTAAGAALPEIMLAGGWRSPQMPAHYARKLDARQGAMRRWIRAAGENPKE
jgi:integrase/recombinase XerD